MKYKMRQSDVLDLDQKFLWEDGKRESETGLVEFMSLTNAVLQWYGELHARRSNVHVEADFRVFCVVLRNRNVRTEDKQRKTLVKHWMVIISNICV